MHAEDKLELLKTRGFPLTKDQVLDCVINPDNIQEGYKGRMVYQKGFDVDHVLRVICVQSDKTIRVVTFYPGRRKRYEAQI